jgi:flagellar hook-associated protein 3 FlgL
MSLIGRLSSLQRFDRGRNQVTQSQTLFAEHSTRLNTGQRLIHNYDSLSTGKDLVQVTGKILEYDNLAGHQAKAVTELELSESALNNIKELMDEIKADALQASSGTSSDADLGVFGEQLRTFGENIFQLANSKIGNKFLFAGVQSDLKVITHFAGATFANAVYKEGVSDLGERKVGEIESSVGLSEVFTTSSRSAQHAGSSFLAPLTANADFRLIVNNGIEDINVGNISLSAGDSMATVINKINTAFNAAGGEGSIVTNGGGYLQFDTALISDSIDNGRAAIIISQGDNLPNSLGELGLTKSNNQGTSANLISMLANLEAAYNSGDNEAVSRVLIDIEDNLDRVTNAQSKLGDLVSRLNLATEKNTEKKSGYEIKQADIAKIPVAEAIQKVSAAQAALAANIKASAAILGQNIFDFISI